jgi:hypothetical protein
MAYHLSRRRGAGTQNLSPSLGEMASKALRKQVCLRSLDAAYGLKTSPPLGEMARKGQRGWPLKTLTVATG